MIFNSKDLKIKLLLSMNEKPITKREQKIYISSLGYYNAIRFFKKKGLIKCDGVDERGQKIWKLTEKGKKFVNLLCEIKKLLGE